MAVKYMIFLVKLTILLELAYEWLLGGFCGRWLRIWD